MSGLGVLASVGCDIVPNYKLRLQERYQHRMAWNQGPGRHEIKDSSSTVGGSIIGPWLFIHVQFGISHESDMVQLQHNPIELDGNKFSVNNRQLSVKARLLPTDQGTVMASKKGLKGEVIPSDQGTFQVLLRSNEKQMCALFIELCSGDVTLDQMRYDIRLDGEDLEDFQEGYEIEQPRRKHRPQGYYASYQGQEILAQFQIMADNGERDKFLLKRYGMEFQAKSGNRDYQLLFPFVLYEEALMYLHENKLEDAAAVAQLAIGCDQHSANHCYLVAKTKFIFSAIQRRAGNFEESQELLRQAIEFLDGCASGFEKAEAMYAMATLLSEKSAAVGISEADERNTHLYFKDVYRHLDHEGAVENTISSRLRTSSSNRRLNFLLKTSRHARNPANRRAVSEKTMEEARKDIRRVERGTLKSYTMKQKMSFFIVKADFYIMQEDFRNAVEPLNEARDIAFQNHWTEYVDHTTSRLDRCRTGSTGTRSQETLV